MSVIGFDIGNDSCVIATAKRGGVDVLLNDESKRETPSVVSFGDKQRFLGSAGAAFVTAKPKSTISQIKWLIGKVYKEVEEDLKLLPFTTSEGPRGGILIELEYLNSKQTFTPVEILGMLFKHLKQTTEKSLESSVFDCVIGIPSYFTDLQRRVYLDAANIAGLNPLRLLHDGTAIALGYGMYKTDLSKSKPTNVMFVDIGHCDTQVTVAAFKQGSMQIQSHSFDQNLGGRDFDEVLFKYFAEQFNEKHNIDVNSNPRASVRLMASCEKVKKVLSANAEAPLSIEWIGDADVRGIISRDEFEKRSSNLLNRITGCCNRALEDSGLGADELYTIELVGSGSRIPAITRVLTSFFKKEPTRTLNASECVARGCALRCAMLSSNLKPNYKVEDSFPYSIVIPLPQEVMIFQRGTPFPSTKISYIDKDTSFVLQPTYDEERDNFPLGISHRVGHYEIVPFEPYDAEKVAVELKVMLNDNGIVEIDITTILKHKYGRHVYSQLIPSENLDVSTTKDELVEAKEKEEKLTEQDKKVEEIKDQRNTLESFVYETRSKLAGAYESFATASDKEEISNKLQETEDWLYEDSDDESEQDYTGKLNDLKQLLEPIENRYNDENAIAKATNYLQSCIAKYRSDARTLPAGKKEKVRNACDETEQWLQNAAAFQKRRLSEVNRTTESFKRKCKSIINSKSSFVNSQNQDQIYQPLQARIAELRLLAENSLSADMKHKVEDLHRRAEKTLNDLTKMHVSTRYLKTRVDHAVEDLERNYRMIIKSIPSSPRHEEPEGSEQRNQPVDQTDQPVDSAQHMDIDESTYLAPRSPTINYIYKFF